MIKIFKTKDCVEISGYERNSLYYMSELPYCSNWKI